ncbi:hypothetical protein VP142E351_P0064 [Vibrio phage 142E35-1]|nr:hypothetical protein VP142E351_P0064 [Vibrio phage 142E35-1]
MGYYERYFENQQPHYERYFKNSDLKYGITIVEKKITIPITSVTSKITQGSKAAEFTFLPPLPNLLTCLPVMTSMR